MQNHENSTNIDTNIDNNINDTVETVDQDTSSSKQETPAKPKSKLNINIKTASAEELAQYIAELQKVESQKKREELKAKKEQEKKEKVQALNSYKEEFEIVSLALADNNIVGQLVEVGIDSQQVNKALLKALCELHPTVMQKVKSKFKRRVTFKTVLAEIEQEIATSRGV